MFFNYNVINILHNIHAKMAIIYFRYHQFFVKQKLYIIIMVLYYHFILPLDKRGCFCYTICERW